jgi:hypothetical protein
MALMITELDSDDDSAQQCVPSSMKVPTAVHLCITFVASVTIVEQ